MRLRAAGGPLGRVLPVHATGAGEFGALPDRRRARGVRRRSCCRCCCCAARRAALRTALEARFVVGVLNSAIPFACFAFALLSITTGLSAILNATVAAVRRAGGLAMAEGPADRLAHARAWPSVSRAWPCWPGTRPASSRTPRTRPGLGRAGLPGCDALLRHRRQRHQALPERRARLGHRHRQPARRDAALALPALWFWPAQMPGPQAWLALVAVGVGSAPASPMCCTSA